MFFKKKSKSVSSEEINETIQEIKKLSNININGISEQAVKNNIDRILSIMTTYSNQLNIQRVCCHTLSNIAMEAHLAIHIINKIGFKLIRKTLEKFITDAKVCWLGCSALWNLGRPPVNRQRIGRTGAKLLLKVLSIHHTKESVTNTTLGALSNLSLSDEIKDYIASDKHVRVLLSTLSHYLGINNGPVLTSGVGLIANIAVSDSHVSTLLHNGALVVLLRILQKYNGGDDTLYRNTCAALNNIGTDDNYKSLMLKSGGVEIIFDFLKQTSNEEYESLLNNCLIAMDSELDVKVPTTSFHLCGKYGELDIIKDIVKRNVHLNIDDKDGHGETCLDYAVLKKHFPVIEFLSKIGAKPNMNGPSFLLSPTSKNKVDFKIENGQQILDKVIKENQKSIADTVKEFPTDICNAIVEYSWNVDMLTAINEY